MQATSRQRHGCAARAQINREETIPHFPRPIPAVAGIPLPQLAEETVAPAFDCPIIKQHTVISITGCQRHGCAARAQINREETIPHFPRPIPTSGRIPLPQLTTAIRPPALHYSMIEYRTGIAGTSRQCRSRPTHAQINRKQIIPHFPRAIPTSGRIPLPQLARGIPSPTLDRSMIEQRTGMIAIGNNLRHEE